MQSVLFVSHGGGPLPLLGDPGHAGMRATFADIRKALDALPEPEAVLVVSAHWEADTPRITAAAQPSLYYDYHGFPPESYQIAYPVPGSPALAKTVVSQLQEVGIPVQPDTQRGLDHGVFVPGLLLFPNATIPTLQLSLSSALDPRFHLGLGRALRALRNQGVIVIGSGFSFHNMRAFSSDPDARPDPLNRDFERWLSDTVMLPDMSDREQRMMAWADAPGARFCHPREEHLMPLHVCIGAVDGPAAQQWQFEVMGAQGSCYLWN
jgi:4,5-DOPA dioxygenase extradiol